MTSEIDPRAIRVNVEVDLTSTRLYFNPLTAGAAYIRVFIFLLHIK